MRMYLLIPAGDISKRGLLYRLPVYCNAFIRFQNGHLLANIICRDIGVPWTAPNYEPMDWTILFDDMSEPT